MILVTRNCSKFDTDANCSISVVDGIEYNNLKIEKDTKDGEWKQLERTNFVSIYIAQLNTSKESKIIFYKVEENTEDTPEITIPSIEDGYISLYHIVIPWYDQIDWDDDIIYNFRLGHYYYLDGVFSTVVKYKKRVGDAYGTFYKLEPREVEDLIQEILTIIENQDTEAYKDLFESYIINITEQYPIFSICHLRKCYKNICQSIFNSRIFDKCFKAKVNSDLIFRRDLVWATINVIQYLVDSKQFAEAQLVLERINECPGLCTEQEKESGKKGCGCK